MKTTTQANEQPCKCLHWARSFDTNTKLRDSAGNPLVPLHHPNCEHFNDSLMDVWKVELDGCACYVETEEAAKDTAGEPEDNGELLPTITKVKMHREIFENLREFDGF